MAAEVIALARRSGINTKGCLSDAERAAMRHMRLIERVEVKEIALRFKVSTFTAREVTYGCAPPKQALQPANPAWGRQLVAAMPELFKMAKKLGRTPDRADDLLQETLSRALAYESGFEQGTNLHSWLYVIMRNIHLTGFRRTKYEVEDPDNLFAAQHSLPPEQGHAHDLRCLSEALHDLPAAQAQAIRLVCLEGMTYDQAADIADVETGTIKSRLSRGREALAKALGIDSSDFLTDGVLAATLKS